PVRPTVGLRRPRARAGGRRGRPYTAPMNRSVERWGALAGVASVLLLIPALVVSVVSGDQPAPDASTARIVRYLVHHRGPYLSSLFLEIISLALLVWFVAVLMNSLGGAVSLGWLISIAMAGVVGVAILRL